MIFNLDNISTLQFMQLPVDQANQYWELQNIMTPIDKFGRFEGKPLGQLQFGQVAMLKDMMKDADYEGLKEAYQNIFGINEHQFQSSPVTDFLSTIGWIRKSLIELIEKENKALQSDPDPDLQLAGVARLNPFGEMNTLIAIAQQFSTTPHVVETWTYNTVFTIMLHNKTMGEVQKEYIEIKRKKK